MEAADVGVAVVNVTGATLRVTLGVTVGVSLGESVGV